MKSWAVELNGAVLVGGDDLPSSVAASGVLGWLSEPPDGVGVPDLRTEDQTFPQQDGVAHYSDWYEPRIITLNNVSVKPDGCDDATAREKSATLLKAWARQTEDVELVIWTDVEVAPDQEGRAATGPFGMRGRPRVAQMKWTGQGSKTGQGLFRFDGADHRLYILDAAGTPGSGQDCQAIALTKIDPVVTPTLEYAMSETAGTTTPTVSTPDATYNVPYQGLGLMARGITPLSSRLRTATYFNFPSNSFPYNTFLGFTFASPMSVSVWWQPYPGSVGAQPILWASSSLGWSIWTDHIQGVDNNDYNFSAGTAALLADGNPHKVTLVTTSGSAAKLYVDGILKETLAYTGVFPNTGASSIISPAKGFYSNLRYYHTALTAAQELNIYRSDSAAGTDLDVAGNLSAPVTVTFTGPVTSPQLQLDDGTYVGLNIIVPAGQIVVIDTATGDATMWFGSVGSDIYTSVIAAVTGDPFFRLPPGESVARVLTQSSADTGSAQVCWRPSVVSA